MKKITVVVITQNILGMAVHNSKVIFSKALQKNSCITNDVTPSMGTGQKMFYERTCDRKNQISYLQSDHSWTSFFHHETGLWFSFLCLYLCVSFSCDVSFDDLHLGALKNLKSVQFSLKQSRLMKIITLSIIQFCTVALVTNDRHTEKHEYANSLKRLLLSPEA
jgi:hypothetical protein